MLCQISCDERMQKVKVPMVATNLGQVTEMVET
jgi:hypothetical protein